MKSIMNTPQLKEYPEIHTYKSKLAINKNK